jgi:hypothetical protein
MESVMITNKLIHTPERKPKKRKLCRTQRKVSSAYMFLLFQIREAINRYDKLPDENEIYYLGDIKKGNYIILGQGITNEDKSKILNILHVKKASAYGKLGCKF